MKHGLSRRLVIGLPLAMLLASAALAAQLPAIGAAALLHPLRRSVPPAPPEGCRSTTFAGVGISLQGWHCAAAAPRRGTLLYLHGVADNRAGGAGVARRFRPRGLDVVAYDSRAHGESGGEYCTYGALEKQDLRRVLDALEPGPVLLLGTSLGAAVALQAAADDARVTSVIAAETFSDLRTVITERAPFFFTAGTIARAIGRAEQQARFRMADVSPVAAARRLTVPVLLIHGERDADTSPDHSRRVFAALPGPRRLILVPDGVHNGSLRGDVWDDIERWVDHVLAGEVIGEAQTP